MSRCVILAAGPVSDADGLRAYLRADDWFVAADGGLALAKRLGVTPAAVAADFDSGRREDAEAAGAELLRLPVEKDFTDTMAAASLALDKGFREFLILGGTGGRLDHTLANIAVLQYLHNRGAVGWIGDEHTLVRLYSPGNYEIPSQSCHFSLIPYGGPAEGITLQNAVYPLNDAILSMETSLGVSNEFMAKPLGCSFKKGFLLFFLSKD